MTKDVLRWCAALGLMLMQACVQTDSISSSERAVPPPSQSETLALLNTERFAELDARFSAIQANYRNRVISDEQLRNAFRVFYDTDVALQVKYDAWVGKFPKSYVARLARGVYYRKTGQNRRGGEIIANTTDSQLQGMDATFALAMKDLKASAALDKRPLLTIFNEMSVAIFEGDTREIRGLLDQSLRMDPQNVIIRHEYMMSLEPRWGGTVEQMSAFLEESRNAGLSKPKLQLLEAVIISDRADGFKDAGDYPAAEREYRKAVALGSDDCFKCLASVLLLQNKPQEAIPFLSRVANEDPRDDENLALRGQTYLQIGNATAGTADMIAAAALGNVYAENAVAIDYMTGANGLARDPEAGLGLFRKCAAQGSAQCAENVKRTLALHGTPHL